METKKIITTTTTTTTTVTTETIATTNNTATVKKHLPLDGISAKTNQVLCPVVLSIWFCGRFCNWIMRPAHLPDLFAP